MTKQNTLFSYILKCLLSPPQLVDAALCSPTQVRLAEWKMLHVSISVFLSEREERMSYSSELNTVINFTAGREEGRL